MADDPNLYSARDALMARSAQVDRDLKALDSQTGSRVPTVEETAQFDSLNREQLMVRTNWLNSMGPQLSDSGRWEAGDFQGYLNTEYTPAQMAEVERLPAKDRMTWLTNRATDYKLDNDAEGMRRGYTAAFGKNDDAADLAMGVAMASAEGGGGAVGPRTLRAMTKRAGRGATRAPTAVEECPPEAVKPARLLPQGPKGVAEPGATAATADIDTRIKAASTRAGQAHTDDKGRVWPALPEYAARTFDEAAKPVPLAEGTKLYRIVGDGSNPAGEYWTRTPPPATEAEWRSQAAVMGEWNGDGGYVEQVVGPKGMLVWEGPAAPQYSSDSSLRLSGGGGQIWSPKDQNQPSTVRATPWAGAAP